MASKVKAGTLAVANILILLLITQLVANFDNTSLGQPNNDYILSAYVFMNTSCFDFTYGGHYHELDQSGTPISRNKFLGIEAWIIKGALDYYNYSWDLEALTHAIDTFNTIEVRMRNPSHTYNARMVEDWSSAIIGNSRTMENSCLIRALVELYKHTGNVAYYETAIWLMFYIHYFHRNTATGGYHIEVDEFGNPNLTYYPYGYLPGYVALACASLLTFDPTNATFLEELNYALNFALESYWDSPNGGYCSIYTPSGSIYESFKPLHMQSVMIEAFVAGYLFTANMTYRYHAIEIANLILNHWTDAYPGFVMDVSRTLSVTNSKRNAIYLAYTARAFLDLYLITGNTTYLDSGVEAMNFIRLYHYDPSYLGYYAECYASGNPADTTKKPGYQSDILSALVRYDFGDEPPPTTTEPPTTTDPPPTTPTTPTIPSLGFLLPLTIIGGTIIALQVVVIAVLLTQRRQKSVKYPRLISSADSSEPKRIRFCAGCGSQIRPDDRFCAGCGKAV